MASKDTNSDIEILISEIRHIKTNLNDPVLGSAFWEEAMKDFIGRYAGDLITLLEELERLREPDPGNADNK